MRRSKWHSSLHKERSARSPDVKIQFGKVGHSPQPFREESEGLLIEGTLQKNRLHRVRLQAKIEGSLSVNCDRCGVLFDYPFNVPLDLTVSDQIVEAKDDLDIIEFLDGEIDISCILQGEINSVKSEYHYCDACQKSDDVLEMEF